MNNAIKELQNHVIQTPKKYMDRDEIQTKNMLLKNINPLLIFAMQIKNNQPETSAIELRQKLVSSIRDFERNAKIIGVPAMHVLTARYIVCTLLDEVILNTKWGNKINWSEQTLLSLFHEDTSGGEVFFGICEKLQEQPNINIDLLELIYICICLGFRGKYRLDKDGNQKIEILRQRLFALINHYRDNEIEKPKNYHTPTIEKRIPDNFSMIKIAIFLAVFLIIIFSIFKINILENTKSTVQELNNIATVSNSTQGLEK